MSLWCPYIKANYCFLWSCNKYILRHPVAKGADCFQERTWTFCWRLGRGPGSPECPPPAPSSRPCHDCLCAGWQKKGKGLDPSPGLAPQIQQWWVGAGASGRLGGGRPVKPSGPLSQCHSCQRVISSDGFYSPYSARS